MSERYRVLRSIETPDGDRCVDLYLRPDGTYGFAEYRRDVEDPSGWFAPAAPPDARYATAEAALREALAQVPWLAEVVGSEG